MKIICPKCNQAVPANQANATTDAAFCPECNETFRISQSTGLNAVNPDILNNPPKGAWFRKESDRVVLGATTRSALAFILVPFICVWTGFSLGIIYGSQILSGKFDPYWSLFGIPFLIFSVYFGTFALMAVFGKVEVTIGKNSSVFVGIGSLGWTRKFDWLYINSIEINPPTKGVFGGFGEYSIVLKGKVPIDFGKGVNELRKRFLINALRYLLYETRGNTL